MNKKSSLRIIISLHLSPTTNAITKQILSQFPVSYCDITYQGEAFEIKNCKNVQFLNHDEIGKGIYPTELSSLTPLDDELLRKLSYCETITLQMMNRSDWDDTLTYMQRKERYLAHVRFWNNEILTKKINLCIFYEVPHTIYDYVLYSLCKIYSIPVICVASQRFKDTLFLTHDYEHVSIDLLSQYRKFSILLRQKSISDIKKNISNAFINKVTRFDYKSVSPATAVNEQKRLELYMYLHQIGMELIKNPVLILKLFNPLFILHRLKSIFKKQLLKIYYWMQSEKPDLSKKFVYVALHYQPECTTSPMAGVYVNQELIIHMLHQLLPNDVYLYVKEHPVTSNAQRSIPFYRSLRISPRVKLIKISVNSQELITHSIAVATATGTAGWEALLKQKPVMMFGYDFYQYAPGVFRISNLKSCKNAISKILNRKFKLSMKDLYIFLNAMEIVSIDGYLDYYFKPFSHLSSSANIKNVSHAIIQTIRNL